MRAYCILEHSPIQHFSRRLLIGLINTMFRQPASETTVDVCKVYNKEVRTVNLQTEAQPPPETF